MDIDNWLTEAKRQAKSDIEKNVVNYIQKICNGDNPNKPTKKISVAEIDGGTMVVWVRKSGTRKIFITLEGQILERGVERWPHGKTVLMEKVCDVMESDILVKGQRRAQRALSAARIGR